MLYSIKNMSPARIAGFVTFVLFSLAMTSTAITEPAISGGIAVDYERTLVDSEWTDSESAKVRFSLRGDWYHADIDFTDEGAEMKRTYIAYQPFDGMDMQIRAGNIRLPKGMASWTGYVDTIHSSLDGFGRAHDLGVAAHLGYGPATWIMAIDRDSNMYARGAVAVGDTETGIFHFGTHVWNDKDSDLVYGGEIAGAMNRVAASAEFLPVSEHWYSTVRFSVLGHSYDYSNSVFGLSGEGALEASYRVAQVPDTMHSAMASYNVTDALSVSVNYDWDGVKEVVTIGSLYTF